MIARTPDFDDFDLRFRGAEILRLRDPLHLNCVFAVPNGPLGRPRRFRLRGELVRFILPDVVRELREEAQTSKRGVTRRI